MKYEILPVCCIILATVHANSLPRELSNSFHLSANNIQEAYDGLDITRDGVVNVEDLNKLFYHKEAEFAKTKFIQLIDVNKQDQEIQFAELKVFLEKQPIINAVYECTLIHSNSLRQYCFADQILRYVVLVLDHRTVEILFKKIAANDNKDYMISSSDVKRLQDVNNDFIEEEQVKFIDVVGGGENKITREDFTEFILQESLQGDFRRCRDKLEGSVASYDEQCLIKQLINYTMNHMTELEIANVFIEFSSEESFIVEEDLAKTKTCSSAVAARFVELMDTYADKKISYGEFWAYMKSHTVRLHMEKECSQKIKSQKAEIACYKSEILSLIEEHHAPIWLALPSLDILFLFDDLDVNRDGQITKTEDLVKGKQWPESLAGKLIGLTDNRGLDDQVGLEEFYEYIEEPHIVYGLADCAALSRSQDRIDCYSIELQDIIKHLLDRSKVESFFEFYDKDGNKRITADDLKKLSMTGQAATNFLLELGMGDDRVNLREFSWFVSQQELSRMFSKCVNNAQPPSDLNPILLEYLANKMTEHDTQQLFRALDTDGSWELKCSDFGPENAPIVQDLLDRMDFGSDNSVNFFEFWMYLNTPFSEPRKLQLEQKCTRPKRTHQEDIKCYKNEIVNIK